jgi:hypothetical protein
VTSLPPAQSFAALIFHLFHEFEFTRRLWLAIASRNCKRPQFSVSDPAEPRGSIVGLFQAMPHVKSLSGR